MVSNPWIADSAPLLRLMRPSASSPSKVTPVAGEYIACPARFAPKNHDACRAASVPATCVPVVSATAISDCTRESTP